jgi:hypothetical protein
MIFEKEYQPASLRLARLFVSIRVHSWLENPREKTRFLAIAVRRALVAGVGTVKEFLHVKALAAHSAIVLRKWSCFREMAGDLLHFMIGA